MLEFIDLGIVAIVCCSYIVTKLRIHCILGQEYARQLSESQQKLATEKAAKIEEQKKLKQEKVMDGLKV